MDRILQELSPRWLRLFVGHGARGAGGCRALGVRTSLDIVASPGTMLAPALSTDREQQQQQHILVPASAKDALAQHHANHYSVFGAARHTHIQASTRIRAHIRTPAHTHTHAHNYTHTNTHAREHSQARTRMYTCARTNTQTHARAHIQMPKHTGTHTHTHTHTHTCICMHMLRA